MDNLGINLDTANLLLYGKANPLDALDVFGPWVRNLHAKDGFYPTNSRKLGREVAIGEGKVDFPRIIAALHGLGFSGQIVIEREIKGEQQAKDITKAVAYLRRLVAEATGGEAAKC
jgi:sugar phosphate isomerase/epimerase